MLFLLGFQRVVLRKLGEIQNQIRELSKAVKKNNDQSMLLPFEDLDLPLLPLKTVEELQNCETVLNDQDRMNNMVK